jgi:hypothetical protein
MAAALALVGGMLVSIPSQALTVTLSGAAGNSCTYQSIAVDGAGNTTVSCLATNSPGTISFASASVSGDAGVGAAVSITRTNGTTGAVSADVTSSIGCTVTNGTASFADGSSATQSVTVTGATPGGTCTLSLGNVVGGATLGGASTFTVNNPTAPGSIVFSATSYSGAVNAGVAVTVNRVGGTAGAVSATLSSTGTGTCTVGQPNISFAAGSTAPVTVTVTGTAQGSCTLALGNAVGGATLGAASTLNVAAANSGSGNAKCQAIGNPAPPANMFVGVFGLSGQHQNLALSSGQVGSLPMPPYDAPYTTTMLIVTQLATSPVEPLSIKMSISPCQGDMTGGGDAYCVKTDTNRAGTDFKWTKGDARYFVNKTIANTYGYCWTPGPNTDYYINIQYSYSGCGFGGTTCGFSVQHNVADGRMIE